MHSMTPHPEDPEEREDPEDLEDPEDPEACSKGRRSPRPNTTFSGFGSEMGRHVSVWAENPSK